MNFDKFTEKAMTSVTEAQEIAVRKSHQQVEGEHIHMALASRQDGLIPRLLGYMGVDVTAYIRDIEAELDKLPVVQGSTASPVYASRRFNQLLVRAQDETKQFKDEYTSVEHIFIALLKEHNTPSQTIFKKHGINLDGFMTALSKVRSNQRITSQNPEDTYDTLQRFGRDLVEMAREGKIDPVIGRDETKYMK